MASNLEFWRNFWLNLVRKILLLDLDLVLHVDWLVLRGRGACNCSKF